MRRFLFVLIAATAGISGVPLHAHHSYGAAYLENQTVTIEGQLVQLLFRNPHSFVHVVVREKDGTSVRYAVEWGGILELDGQGIGRDKLKIGDRLIISGNPGRNRKDHLLRMLTLERPKDGFGWGHKPGEVAD
jgi:hypothetical protein